MYPTSDIHFALDRPIGAVSWDFDFWGKDLFDFYVMTDLSEVLGWILCAAGAGMLAVPGIFQRFVLSMFDAMTDPGALRVLGVLAVAFGLGLAWFALFVM